MADRALEGIVVLELSGLSGGYCGKLLADLGASVTLIEPPGGSPLRCKPPFAEDVPGRNNGLPFAYFAANKASLVLDLDQHVGLAELAKLARGADLVILADHPQACRVDLEGLRRDNPALVCTRLTSFGGSGPYAAMTGDDLTLMAMGGLLTMAGFVDRPPVLAYGEQGMLAGDQFAAVASMAALLRAEHSGEGELIDVSIQESIVMALENAAQAYDLEGRIRTRASAAPRVGMGIFPCRDGDIFLLAGGIGDTQMWGNFSAWMASENLPDADVFGSATWQDDAPESKALFERVFLPYAAARTKDELYALARQWRVPMAPMSTPTDLLGNDQLGSRGFYVPLPSGPLAGVRVPGAPYKLSVTPWSLRTSAPAFPATGSMEPCT